MSSQFPLLGENYQDGSIQEGALQALISTASAISTAWGRHEKSGWLDAPAMEETHASQPMDKVDIWATSDAVDVLARVYTLVEETGDEFSRSGAFPTWEKVQPEVESALVNGIAILLKELQKGSVGLSSDVDITGSLFAIKALASTHELPERLTSRVNLGEMLGVVTKHLYQILGFQADSGAFTVYGKRTSLYATALALWVICQLLALPRYSEVEAWIHRQRIRSARFATIWLLQSCLPDGSFPYFQEAPASSVSRTGLSLIALASAQAELPPHYCPQKLLSKQPLYQSISWLMGTQLENGALADPKKVENIPDTESTSLSLLAFLTVGCSPRNQRVLRGIQWLLSQRIMTPLSGWSLFGETDKIPRLWTTSHVVGCLVDFLKRTRLQQESDHEKVEIAKLNVPRFLYANESKELGLQMKKLSRPVPIVVSAESPKNVIKLKHRPVFMGQDEQMKVEIIGAKTGKEKGKVVVENIVTGDKTQKGFSIRVVSKSLEVFVDTLTDMRYIALSIFLGTLLLSLIRSLTLRSIVLSLENIILIPLVLGLLILIAYINSRIRRT